MQRRQHRRPHTITLWALVVRPGILMAGGKGFAAAAWATYVHKHDGLGTASALRHDGRSLSDWGMRLQSNRRANRSDGAARVQYRNRGGKQTGRNGETPGWAEAFSDGLY